MVSGFTQEKLGVRVVPPYWLIVRKETRDEEAKVGLADKLIGQKEGVKGT